MSNASATQQTANPADLAGGASCHRSAAGKVSAVCLALLGFATLMFSLPQKPYVSPDPWQMDLFAEAAQEHPSDKASYSNSLFDAFEAAGHDSSELAADLIALGIPAFIFAADMNTEEVLSHTDERERACLSQAIYFEARNQPLLGQLAVADVVLNRVADERFPGTICGVVFQGSKKRWGCQFSFTCDGSMRKAREPAAWQSAEQLADIIYRGFRPPLTRLATFYHADYVDPYWAKVFDETAFIGDHIFYRPKNALKLAASRLGLIDTQSPS